MNDELLPTLKHLEKQCAQYHEYAVISQVSNLWVTRVTQREARGSMRPAPPTPGCSALALHLAGPAARAQPVTATGCVLPGRRPPTPLPSSLCPPLCCQAFERLKRFCVAHDYSMCQKWVARVGGGVVK
jgi:hypothetical protein